MGIRFSQRTYVRRTLKCLEPLGYDIYKNPVGLIITKNSVDVWHCTNYREAHAYLAGVIDSHPFREKIHREYMERMNDESMAGNSKR